MKTILIPTNFSSSSENALKNWLSLRNASEPVKILLLNTFLVPPAMTTQSVAIHDELKRNSLRQLEEERNAYNKNPAYRNNSFEILSYMGSLDNVVAYLTQERNIDCVILGVSRNSRSENLVKIFNRVNCPILVVPKAA